MSRPVKHRLVPLAAAALVGVALPVSAGPASAADSDQGFGGFTSSAVAAPVKIEIYEPTIPIPADPQLEVELAYSKVEADSGSSTGRASWLWPGDPVGEGLKTFVEQLGLPPQLGENGYPVQVNSSQPSGEPKQSDEPFPGTVMRTSSSEGTTLAQVGFSPDSKVRDGAEDDGEGDAPAVPGLPGLPGLSAGAAQLQQFGKALTGGLTTAQGDAAENPGDEGTPGLPPQLAALVDVEGYTSSSKNVATGSGVTTTARSALGDVTLLGGLVTLDGVVATSSSTSDGVEGAASDKVSIGGIMIAGQRFAFGPQGFDAAGKHVDIPALPGGVGPDAALEQLGIKLELPDPVRTHQGDQAGSDVSALRVDIDTGVLRHKLDALPINALVDALPGNPPQLKSAVQTLAGLAPRVVVTLGVATTEVDTVAAMDLPTDLPAAGAPGAGSEGGGTSAGSGSGGAGSAGAPPAASAPSASTPAGAAPSAAELPPSELAGSGLPPLYTIPGAILAGGIALAAIGGTWLRRIGVIALGGAGSCSHGLDSGLPDLRKAP
jgi:hypothetical protein